MRGVAYRDGGRERERARRRLSTRDTARDTACREVRASGSTAREIETKRGERPEQPCTADIMPGLFSNCIIRTRNGRILLTFLLRSHTTSRDDKHSQSRRRTCTCYRIPVCADPRVACRCYVRLYIYVLRYTYTFGDTVTRTCDVTCAARKRGHHGHCSGSGFTPPRPRTGLRMPPPPPLSLSRRSPPLALVTTVRPPFAEEGRACLPLDALAAAPEP